MGNSPKRLPTTHALGPAGNLYKKPDTVPAAKCSIIPNFPRYTDIVVETVLNSGTSLKQIPMRVKSLTYMSLRKTIISNSNGMLLFQNL